MLPLSQRTRPLRIGLSFNSLRLLLFATGFTSMLYKHSLSILYDCFISWIPRSHVYYLIAFNSLRLLLTYMRVWDPRHKITFNSLRLLLPPDHPMVEEAVRAFNSLRLLLFKPRSHFSPGFISFNSLRLLLRQLWR